MYRGLTAFAAPLVQGCDSADVDSATGVCAHPYWVEQVQLIPQLDALSGVAISVAILCVWALAYGWSLLGRTVED